MVDFATLKVTMFDPVYPVISFIVLAASFGVAYITRKLYYATAGASYYWMFISGFTSSIAVYALANFARKTFLGAYSTPLKSVQDIALVASAVFALVAAIFVNKMFEEIGE